MINIFERTLKSFKTELTEKKARLKFLDNQFTDFYHGLEIMELGHIADSHNFLKAFQKNLKERRVLKSDIVRLELIVNNEGNFRSNHGNIMKKAEEGLQRVLESEGLIKVEKVEEEVEQKV